MLDNDSQHGGQENAKPLAVSTHLSQLKKRLRIHLHEGHMEMGRSVEMC